MASANSTQSSCFSFACILSPFRCRWPKSRSSAEKPRDFQVNADLGHATYIPREMDNDQQSLILNTVINRKRSLEEIERVLSADSGKLNQIHFSIEAQAWNRIQGISHPKYIPVDFSFEIHELNYLATGYRKGADVLISLQQEQPRKSPPPHHHCPIHQMSKYETVRLKMVMPAQRLHPA